jgi:DNA-binding MarR family transcriptional regulator
MEGPLSLAEVTHVRDTCLCLHTQRTARVLARRFDETLRPVGLSNEQFSLLMALNGPEPTSLAAIGALLGADRTTVTAALKPLARRGFVSIMNDAEDRRVRRVTATEAGRACLVAALPLWTSAHEMLEGELGDTDPSRLRRDLDALAARRFATSACEDDGGRSRCSNPAPSSSSSPTTPRRSRRRIRPGAPG